MKGDNVVLDYSGDSPEVSKSKTLDHDSTDEHAVVIYGTSTCGLCMMARQLLRARSIGYEWRDVARDRERRAWLLRQSGQSTVRQIFIHGQSVGGFSELRRMDASGELRDRLSEQ